MSLRSHLLASESVCQRHPDKIADQIPDAILDAFLRKDVFAHVSCQSLVTHRLIVVAAEFRTTDAIFSAIQSPAAARQRAAARLNKAGSEACVSSLR